MGWRTIMWVFIEWEPAQLKFTSLLWGSNLSLEGRQHYMSSSDADKYI